MTTPIRWATAARTDPADVYVACRHHTIAPTVATAPRRSAGLLQREQRAQPPGGARANAPPPLGAAHRSCRGQTVVAHFKSSTDSRIDKRRADLATRMLYLTNFWYAAGFSKDVKPGGFHCTKLLDTPVVLWRNRTTGTVRCITDICPATGRPLSGRFKLCTAPSAVGEGPREVMCGALTCRVLVPLTDLNAFVSHCSLQLRVRETA
jgi:Rieske [2Fe-2S] domain